VKTALFSYFIFPVLMVRVLKRANVGEDSRGTSKEGSLDARVTDLPGIYIYKPRAVNLVFV
jgi:hypothetical protein